MRYQAFYTDGKKATRHEVSLMLVVEGLTIHDSEGGFLDRWPYRGLSLLEESFEKKGARLIHKERGDAALTVVGQDFLSHLERIAGRRMGGHPYFRPTWKMALVTTVVLIGVVALLIFALPRLTTPLAGLVPLSWEEELGTRSVAIITAGHPFCSSPAGSAVLERLAARIIGDAKFPHPLVVQVSSHPAINAFAAPGGRIVLLRGLLEKAENPEEVSGVLAHEIAHSLERHPLKGLLRAVGLQLLFSALIGDLGAIEKAAGEFGALMVIFSYTRADELTADRIGLELLNRADISGDGLPEFFARLSGGNKNAGGVPSFLSTHPLHQERISLIKSLASGQGPALNQKEWEALRNICQ